GIPAGCLHSGQSDFEKREVFIEIDKGGAYILYLSPERAQKEGFQRWIQGRAIALFAIDEAHCVSQWGHDFRAEYAQLNILKAIRPDVPVLALTASATPTVLADVSRNLHLKSPQRHVHGFYRPNLYYQVEFCADDDGKILLLLEALKRTPEGRVIVYCGTRKVTEEVAEFLQQRFSGVGFYHAGMSTGERNTTQDSYEAGKLRILVATNAFGMGIDQPNVRLVVHYQMPANIDSLYQEMGRAGRDGKESTCLMLYSRKDKGLQGYFITSSEAPQPIKNARWRNLEALVNYSEGGECRHAEILTYYKDAQRIERCGHCDTCDPQSARRVPLPEIPKEVANGDTDSSVAAISFKKLKSSKAKTRAASATDVVLDRTQEQRFQHLKQWRKEKAKEIDAPAFVVFSDQTLKQLAIHNPESLEGLRNIHGIGEAKLEKYGWDLLAELGHRTDDTNS
ncbi:MAG TPA: RecQ family ATP-dependent DNA helicase, partial [Bdellovibrio sp.]|nr:RecQ family ATP-dependent DNA helicase [Bdellovibrio sp.]